MKDPNNPAAAADAAVGDAPARGASEPQGVSPVRTGALTPLRSRAFTLLFTGQFISLLGDQAYAIALPWTVLVATGDPRQMALVLAAETVPRVAFLLLGGALADRLSPRWIMLVADLGRAGVVIALGVTLFSGLPSLPILLTLAALQGVGSGLFLPGSQAIVPWTVSDAEVPPANGLLQLSIWASMVIGPILGGIGAATQAAIAFLIDGASFLVSAVTLAAMHIKRPVAPSVVGADAPGAPMVGQADEQVDEQVDEPKEAQESASDGALAAPSLSPQRRAPQSRGLGGSIAAGVAYTFRQPLLRATMTVATLGNLAYTGAFGVALIVLSRSLDPNAVALGLLLGASGVGGGLGGLWAGSIGRRRRRGLLVLTLWLAMAAVLALVPLFGGAAAQLPFPVDLRVANFGTVTIGGVSLGPIDLGDWVHDLDATGRLVAIALTLGVVSAIIALGETVFTTIVQQRTAPELMARVFSVQFVAAGVTQPISLALAGLIVPIYGSGVVLLGAAALFGCAALIGLGSSSLRHA